MPFVSEKTVTRGAPGSIFGAVLVWWCFLVLVCVGTRCVPMQCTQCVPSVATRVVAKIYRLFRYTLQISGREVDQEVTHDAIRVETLCDPDTVLGLG